MEMLVNIDVDEALQLQREAELAGFRPATLHGVHPSELRARALEPPRLTAAHLALAVLLVGGGFFLGRFLVERWRKRKSTGVVGAGLDAFVVGRAAGTRGR